MNRSFGKRILSFFVMLGMIVGCLPAVAWAAEETVPESEYWTVLDDELYNLVPAGNDGKKVKFGPYKGLSGYGEWNQKTTSANYTHTNGEKYEFKRSWQTGSGSVDNRCFYFTPKQACIVVVPYTADTGRPLYIVQGGKTLASGEGKKDASGNAATLVADVEDPSAGDVYVYGGSSNKDVFGIFVDYYDPTQIVNQKVSGKIDYSGSADTSNVKVIFTDTKDQTKYEVPFGATYSVELRQNRNFDITIEENGAVSNKLAVTLDTNYVSVAKMEKTFDFKVVDIAPTKVTGDVVVHNIVNDNEYLDLSGVKLQFKAKDDDTYTYSDVAINNNKIEVTMMPNHEYEVTATGADGYVLSPLSQSYVMAAGDDKPFKNILFNEVIGDVEFASEIQVGADKKYVKINDAITAVKAMKDRPEGEAGRVSLVLDPGMYVEQVQVDTPYVTIKSADESNKSTISFYYGVAYMYYSSDGKFYSEDCYVQKTKVSPIDRWGAVVRVTQPYFIAENIIMENSFNCRVVSEELADGVTAAGEGVYKDTKDKPDRTVANYDAKTQAATERAAVFTADNSGDNWVLYNCDLISSQDTLHTGKTGYVKNCYIEGGTDYIFGGNSVLFEDCTLAWHGYSDSAKGGYITACSNSDKPSGTPNLNANGYLFKNCIVTNSKYYPNNKFHAGGWGRNWGGVNCQVVFKDTNLAEGVPVPGAWNAMTGKLTDSVLFVEGVKKADGTAVDVSGTDHNPSGTMASKNYTIMKDTDYFGTWTPAHYGTGGNPNPPTPPEPDTDVIPGNFDGNEELDINDAAELLDYILNSGKEKFKDYTELQFDVADVNGDDILTAEDVSLILGKALSEDPDNFEFPRKTWPEAAE